MRKLGLIVASLLLALTPQARADFRPTQGVFVGYKLMTTSGPIPATDVIINCDATNGPVTYTLPPSKANTDYVTVVKIDSTTNACTPATQNGTDQILNLSTATLTTKGASTTLTDTTPGAWLAVTPLSPAGSTGQLQYNSGSGLAGTSGGGDCTFASPATFTCNTVKGGLTPITQGQSGATLNSLAGSGTKPTASGLSINGVGNAIAFGAKGDGSNDDGIAINSCIAASAACYVPAYSASGVRYTYKIVTPINMTNRIGAQLYGDSYGSQNNAADTSTILAMQTGTTSGGHPQVGIDMTGSSNSVLRNFEINCAYSTSPSIVILQARSSTEGFSQHNAIENVTETCASAPTLNGNVGRIGLYNYGAEVNNYINFQAELADVPIMITPTNTQVAAVSPYATIGTGAQSMTALTFVGGDALVATTGNGPAILFGDSSQTGTVGNIDLGDLYIALNAGGSVGTYAIKADVALDDVVYRGPVENFTAFLDLQSSVSSHLFLYPLVGAAANGDDLITMEDNAGTNLGVGIVESVIHPSFKGAISGTNPTAIVVHELGTHSIGVAPSTQIYLPKLSQLTLSTRSCPVVWSPDSAPTVSGGTCMEKHFGGNQFVGGPFGLNSITFANLPATCTAGQSVYVSDAKSVADGVTMASTCVGAGTGSVAICKASNTWKCGG